MGRSGGTGRSNLGPIWKFMTARPPRRRTNGRHERIGALEPLLDEFCKAILGFLCRFLLICPKERSKVESISSLGSLGRGFSILHTSRRGEGRHYTFLRLFYRIFERVLFNLLF
eukprot:s13_g17.t1